MMPCVEKHGGSISGGGDWSVHIAHYVIKYERTQINNPRTPNMARTSSPEMLDKLITSLRKDRQQLLDQLAAIDATFTKLGINPEVAVRRGRPKGTTSKAKAGRRRKRRRFEQNAEQFVLGLLKEKPMTASEVNAAWKKSGRAGVSNNALTKLYQGKQIKRSKGEGKRGGVYEVV